MHRLKSLEPFTRHFTGQQFFDMLDITDNGQSTSITVNPDSVDVFAPILAKYKQARESQMILYVSFTSVVDYMWLLRAACECLAAFEDRAVLYLAAAVSDFYIPQDLMVSNVFFFGCKCSLSLSYPPKCDLKDDKDAYVMNCCLQTV